MGGSFQSPHPVVFGHGFDRMAADNFLCQLSFKARKVPWPWSQGTAETLLAQPSNSGYKLGTESDCAAVLLGQEFPRG